MSDLDELPTEAYIRALYEHVSGAGSGTSSWSRQRTADREHLDLIYDEHPILTVDTNRPDTKRPHRPTRMSTGEAGRIVERIVALHEPTAQIGLMAMSDSATGDSTREEQEIGVNEAMDQLNPYTDPVRQLLTWEKVALGRSVQLGPMQGNGYWWDMPQPDGQSVDDYYDRLMDWRAHAPLPLVKRPLRADQAFPASWGRLNDEVLAWLVMTWWDTLDMFSEEELGDLLPEASERSKDVTVCFYSNRNWLAYCVMTGSQGYGVGAMRVGAKPDKIVRTFQHNLGQSAIRIQPGATGGRKEDGRYWRSALHLVAPLIKNADRLLTLAGSDVEMRALPMLKRLRFLDSQSEEMTQEEKLRPGDVVPLWVDRETGRAEDIAPIVQASGSADLFNTVLLLLDRTENISGATEALSGGFGPSGQPAWSKNASIEQAKSTLQPITAGIVNGDLDDADMITRAVVEFGEDVRLYHKEEGGKSKKIVLKPDALKGAGVILKAEYQIKLPMNWRADMDLGMSLMERSLAAGVPVDPFYVMETVMGIEQPMKMFESYIQRRALLHPQVIDRLVGHKLEQLGMELSSELGMTSEEALSRLGELPTDAAQQVVMNIAGQGGNGQGPDLQGLRQAGRAFQRQPGGVTPTETLA